MKNLKQLQLILSIIFMALTSLTAYGQKQGEEFAIYGIRYKIAQTFTSGGIAAFPELYRPGVVTVVGYTGVAKEVLIPAEVLYQGGGYLVTEIGDNAFKAKGLTSVTLPSTLTSIGSHAFAYNELTGAMTLPNSLTSMESSAFAVNRLTSVTIPPNSVTSIPNYAFHRNQLESVTIPPDVTSIGTHAFQFNKLTEVTLPNNLTSIGNSAFWGNDLTGVTLPVNVTRIDQWAFWDNPNLVTVRAKSTNNPLPTLDKDAFKNRGQIHLIVPKGRLQAYSGHPDWTGFRSITEVAVDDTFISDNITYKITEIVPDKEVVIMDYDTSGGSSVDISPTVNYQGIDFEVTEIGDNAFKAKGLTRVTLPSTLTSIGSHAFAYNELTGAMTLPNSLTSMESSAFAVNKLDRVTIPSSVTSIPNYAFHRNQLESVTIPPDVTSIGTHAFQFNKLTEVTLPNNLTSIGNSAFWGNDLTEVTLPVNVTRIDQWAFWDNLNLAMVTVKADSPPTLDKDAFKNRGEIHLIVPRGKKDVYLSSDWTGFKFITEVVKVDDTFISDNITYKITKIVPDKEVKATDYSVTGEAVTIPPTVVHGPNTYTVTAIGDEAFEHNQLTGVTIPNTVASIGEWAFAGNPDLGLVTVKANDPPDIQESTFINRDQIDLVVPKGKRQVYLDHNEWTVFRSITEPVKTGDRFRVEHIRYEITKIVPDKEVAVIAYNTSGGEVIIPPTVDHVPNTNTYTVTSIEDGAFFGKQLTGVVIPNTVTSIGKEAFWQNQLISVVIPNSVMDIGEDAFSQNQLTSVVIPESVTSIGQRAFGANKLESVTIPDGLTSIDQWVFAENDLKKVTIPASVESIGYQAFYDNPNLDLVTVKRNDPPALDPSAFQNPGPDQIDLVVPKDKRQDYLDHNEWTVFRSITEVVERGDTFIADNIAYEVTSLNPYEVEAKYYYGTGLSFTYNGANLMTIPPTVDHGLNTYKLTSIGEFYEGGPGGRIDLLRVEANDPPMLHPTSISGRNQIDVIVPEGTKEAYLAAGWTDFRSITEPYDEGNTFTNGRYTYLITSSNPQTVKAIDYTGTASTVNIPGIVNTVKGPFTVTAIGNEVFKDKGLNSVAIPNSVTSIGEWALAGNLLTEVTIPNNVDSIGYAAFFGNKLTRVTIGNSITSIGDIAFAANRDLVVVWIKATDPPTLHGNNTFPVWTYKINLFVPPGPGNPYRTAEGRWNDYFINIFVNPPQVGSLLFLDIYYKVTFLNPNEVEVATDNNISGIAGGAVTIPSTVDYFGFHTYTVTAIAGRAFYNKGLTSVTIPNSVTSIKEGAFENNPNLETVTVKANDPPSLHPNAFQNADRNQIDLIVPIGKKQEYLDNGWHGFRSTTEAAIAATQSSSAWGASTVKSEVAPAHSNKGNELENFTVYPNPVQDRIHIRLSDGEALQQVTIYNTQGVHVYSANTLQIDISHLPGGMYMLEIETKAGKRVVKRVIVK